MGTVCMGKRADKTFLWDNRSYTYFTSPLLQQISWDAPQLFIKLGKNPSQASAQNWIKVHSFQGKSSQCESSMQTHPLSSCSPAAESSACAGAPTMKLAAEKCSAHKLTNTEIYNHMAQPSCWCNTFSWMWHKAAARVFRISHLEATHLISLSFAANRGLFWVQKKGVTAPNKKQFVFLQSDQNNKLKKWKINKNVK